MTALWDYPDFDAHEQLCLFDDPETGLRAIIAIHSTHRGPASGGARFWHYADQGDAITDALRLSRGMSYKNAMADLPVGGGKGVILAQPGQAKAPELLAKFGECIDALGGRYVTAEDVGMTDADMQVIATRTRHVSGLPVAAGQAGGNPGPSTALGVFLGLEAAVLEGLGKASVAGLHIAVQGVGSVGGGVARLAAASGARLTLADVNAERAALLAQQLGAAHVPADAIMHVAADVFSPNALGAVLTHESVAALQAPVVAGGANNQLKTEDIGADIQARGITYAPDYVINAGGIINVSIEYLRSGDRAEVDRRIRLIPDRLREIWAASKAQNIPASDAADNMAKYRIGRG